MPLTVKDILEKTFKRSFKGYDEDEVDRFLDQVIDEFKALQAENASLKASLAETSEHINRVSETEATIMNTLISAQKSSERLLAEAARKAELIIDSAQTTATRRAEQTKTEVALAEKRLEEIKGQATVFAESFANLINSQAASFQQAYRDYFGESDSSYGISTEATRRISADVETGLKDIGAVAVPENGDEPAATGPEDAGDASGPEEPEPYGIAQMEPAEPEMPAEPIVEAAAEPAVMDEPVEAASAQAIEAPLPESEKGVLSLQEINKALQELEEQDGGILGEEGEGDNDSRPRYDDYSWLYDGDSTEPAQEISGKDDEELKSLIDEVID